jgi:uncharacterized protein
LELYSGPSKQFIDDSVHNQLAEKLKTAFFEQYRFNPSPSEVNSWRNSLRAMSQVIQYAGLEDNGILLEYQLPLTSLRIDCMITGESGKGKQEAVIVELKQWEKAAVSEGDYILTFVGRGERDVLHPSVQAFQYRTFLQDIHSAFYESPAVGLTSCSYLHNYAFGEEDALLDSRYLQFITQAPLFGSDDVDKLADYLKGRLDGGEGMPVLERIRQSHYRPSPKLMNHVAQIIKGNPAYTLLDEQLVVYDRIFATLKQAKKEPGKHVIIVKGGPGTGKSVIALNLMADAMKKGFASHYATGSKAFTETLRKIVGTRGSSLFKYFNSYGGAPENSVDLLVCDEAHRIRKTSNSMYTPKAARTDLPQVAELLKAARVSAFLIDDHQVVRPNEIGSVEYLRTAAKQANAQVREYELDVQFRCGGSAAFVNWVNNTLGIERTANVLWDHAQDFEVKIFDSPPALENAIRSRVGEGRTARVVAGFCWEWSAPKPDGTLVDDIVIADYRRPWDARYDAKKLAPGIPKASLWAYDPRGIDQIGCVYTAQGFEFDYVGVIIGRDLYYDPASGMWKGRPEESHDTTVKRAKGDFVKLVQNTYRVLLSRGMKGCYLYFMDKDTENFVRSRMEMKA